MLCEKCKKNNATVFLKENINGKETKYALCAECMDKLEAEGKLSLFGDFPSFFESPMDNIFGALFAPSFANPTKSERKKCTLCGSTFDDLRAGGKVGCAKCYEIFSEELAPTVARIHGNSKHTGCAPSKFKAKLDRKKQIASLEREMKEAIKEQNFERAAELRDEIKAIREEGGAA